MKLVTSVISALLIVWPGSPPQDDLYRIDLAQSTIGVTIYQDGMLAKVRPSHAIVVKNFSGWVRYSRGKESQATVELDAEAKSLVNAEKEIGEIERREFEKALRDVVLEAPKYPQILFRSTSITDLRQSGQGHSFTLHGDVLMHGVKRRLSIPVEVVVSGKQLTGTGSINFKQTDFSMKPYEAAFGLIKIRDELKVSFSIVAKAS